jgi:hypothetical protein
MNIPDHEFANSEKILDVGGWFKPEPRATHVVDLMPWETRRARLSLTSLPGERFNKATWFQADFLKPDLKLPFADKSFDLVVCGHTIEDLTDAKPLLREMQRIGVRGVIECPSRLTEQTKGIRDRESVLPGHPHHQWIVDSTDRKLLLYSKEKSGLRVEARLLPLSFTERRIQEGRGGSVVIHSWHDEIDYHFFVGRECQTRAEEFVASMEVSTFLRIKDRAWRFARRMRRRLRRLPMEDQSWWPKFVELSRPYSSIELPPTAN